MQNDNDRESRDRQNNGGGEGGFNWKGIVLLSIALGLIGLALYTRGNAGGSDEIPYQKFKELAVAKKIVVDEKSLPPKYLQLVQRDNSKKIYIAGWYEVENPAKNKGQKYARFRTPVILEFAKEDLDETLKKANLTFYEQDTEEAEGWMTILSFYLPFLLLIFLLYLLFRHQIR
ncbi:MAG: hypothetical protein KDL87_05875, partial [Verrucomicrobiae bacterium]|nr:hypothetical protein [Verrucomicrobiae bacterium]